MFTEKENDEYGAWYEVAGQAVFEAFKGFTFSTECATIGYADDYKE